MTPFVSITMNFQHGKEKHYLEFLKSWPRKMFLVVEKLSYIQARSVFLSESTELDILK